MKFAKLKDGTTIDYEIRLTKAESKRVGQEPGEQKTVLGLLEEARTHSGRWDVIRQRAARNKRFVDGDQYQTWDTSRAEAVDLAEGCTYTVRNLMRSPWATTTARILSDRPQVHAYAGSNDVRDIMAARIVNRLVEYHSRETDIDSKDHMAAGECQCAGVVGYRVGWDPNAGPPSTGFAVDRDDVDLDDAPYGYAANDDGLIAAGAPTGDLVLEPVTVHDFYTDGQPDIEMSSWVVFPSSMSVVDAKAAFVDAKINEDPSEVELSDAVVTAPTSTDARPNRGVVVEEFWHRDTPDVPGGFYAEIIGGHVVDVRPFPYDHGQLPLSMWQWASDRSAIAPRTHVDDAIPEQVAVNRLLGAIDRLIEENSKVKTVVLSGLTEALDGNVTKYEAKSLEEMQGYRNIDPPQIPPILGQTLVERSQAVYVAMGQTEQISGVAQAGSSTPARAIAYQNALYAEKLAGAVQSYKICKRRMWAQAMGLIKQYVRDDRLLDIAGDDQFAAVEFFSGADIDGADVRLELSAGASRAAEAAEAEAAGAAGRIPLDESNERMETGLAGTQAEADTARAVVAQINRVLHEGEPPQALPGVDTATATETIRGAIAIHGNDDPLLLALLQIYSAPQVPPGAQPPSSPPDSSAGDPQAAIAGLDLSVL